MATKAQLPQLRNKRHHHQRVDLEQRLRQLRARGGGALGASAPLYRPGRMHQGMIRDTGPGIPAEVRAYGATSPAFPHESTANQWFSESQFESYRALGFHQVSKMFGSKLTTLSDWSVYLDSAIGRRPPDC